MWDTELNILTCFNLFSQQHLYKVGAIIIILNL